jgi:hypothetical protein
MLYSIPALYCPFPIAIHPRVNEIEEHTNQWILDFNLLDNYETFVHFRESQFGHFIGRSFPSADFMKISAWSDLNALLFIVDDQIDAQDIIKDKESFFGLMDTFIEVLRNRRKCTVQRDDNVLAALSDFWQRITMLTDERWQNKFIKSIKDMFEGGYWQFEHLLLGKKPQFEEYIKVRQYFGAAHLSTDALEGIAGIDLPQYVYEDPMVHRLTEIARNTICFSNDLFSFGKETQEMNNGAEFNLVTIVKEKYHLTIEEAIQKTADIHDELIREFIFLSGNVYRFDEAVNETLKTYVDALGVLQRGNIEWSTRETKRYPHIYQFPAPEVVKN